MSHLTVRQLALSGILLSILGIATYGRVVQNEYAFDAVPLIQSNPQVAAGGQIADIFSSPYWPTEFAQGRGLYRPLPVLTFHLTRLAWPEPVAQDHAIDLGLHVACGLALLVFLMQMGASYGASLALAALFLLHPVQSEVVVSLVGRTDLLATLFALLTLILSLSRRVSGAALSVGLFVLFSLSLLSKESAVGLVAIVPICRIARETWQGVPLRDAARPALMLVICLGLALVANLVVRYDVLGSLLVSDTTAFGDQASGFFELRWRALAFLTLFVQKLFVPLPLLPDHRTGVVPLEGIGLHVRAVLGLLMLVTSAAWLASAYWRHRSFNRTQLGLLLFWIAIAPVSNLVLQIGTPFAERLLYFPMSFLLLAAVDLPVWRSTPIATLGLAPRLWPAWIVVLIGLSLITAARVPEWKSNLHLFEAAARDCPDNYYAQFTLGSVLYRLGRPEVRPQAQQAMEQAARILPDAYTPRVALGVIAEQSGDLVAARTRFEEAFARVNQVTDLEYQTAALNLARVLANLQDFEALENLVIPLARSHPDWLDLQFQLGTYFASQGRDAEALDRFERVLEGAPDNKDVWRSVIRAHVKLGQDQRAAERLVAAPPGTANYQFKIQLEGEGLFLPERHD